MRLSISTGDKRLSVKLPDDECNKLFNTLVSNTLHFEPVVQEIKRAIRCGDIHEEIRPYEPQPEKATPKAAEAGYTGFLYIRCPKCGKEKGFCAKLPLTESRCRECGEKIELKNLHVVFFTCKCGRSFSYRTNITDDMFEIVCLDCGAPNTVFRNPKTGDYAGTDGARNGAKN